jgi:cystathionine beta-lyase/cystathionine gamma-synthase
VIGGAVLGTAPYIEEVRQKMIVWGQAPDPFSCWLLERGIKTLDVRVRRQNENAMRIAEWCSKRKEVRAVHYPGLADHTDYEIARIHLDGFGGMLGLELGGGGRAADRFVRKLRIFRHATSLGGVDSLISEPRFSSHTNMKSDERSKLGIPDGFLRLSIGLEDADDLIGDIEQALH